MGRMEIYTFEISEKHFLFKTICLKKGQIPGYQQI